VDEPLHDGFGVVIVTIAVRGAAHILLRGGGGSGSGGSGGGGGGGGSGGGAIDEHRCFRLEAAASEAYALSGVARNACLHGVLSEQGSERRCSLNLRFGLHSSDPAGTFPAARVAFE
jgi:hypothetical protein